MSRQEIYGQMRDMFGEVPGFFETLPDSSLELEWELFKRVQFEPGPIPNKYRELIGIAVAAAKGCPYCSFFHTEAARLNGATEDEIEDAVHFAIGLAFDEVLASIPMGFARAQADEDFEAAIF